MRNRDFRRAAAFAALLSAAAAVAAAPAGAETKRLKTPLCLGNETCRKAGAAYEAWELPLKVPAALARCTVYSSTPFYAVILARDVAETAEHDCGDLAASKAIDGAAVAHARAAAAFPERRAFLRLLCTGGDPFVQYSVKGERGMLRSFLALYAGTDHQKALDLQQSAKTAYPEAIMVEMSARLEGADQGCD